MNRFLPLLAALALGWDVAAAQSTDAPLDTLPAVTVSVPADTVSMPADTIKVPTIPTEADLPKALPMTAIRPYRFRPVQLIVPATLISVGIVGVESDWLKNRNKEVRDELQEHVGHHISADDFTQYAPMAAAYGLRLCGVKGLHGYADLTLILGTASLLMGTTVNVMKYTYKVRRPDGSTRNSFPSGHTATAFMGAELLRREYWHVSPWIGMAGYAVALGTGFGRLYNNRHWLTDVMAGAGIGMLSVQVAYWLYPFISRTCFHKLWLRNAYIAPYASLEGKGLSCAIHF